MSWSVLKCVVQMSINLHGVVVMQKNKLQSSVVVNPKLCWVGQINPKIQGHVVQMNPKLQGCVVVQMNPQLQGCVVVQMNIKLQGCVGQMNPKLQGCVVVQMNIKLQGCVVAQMNPKPQGCVVVPISPKLQGCVVVHMNIKLLGCVVVQMNTKKALEKVIEWQSAAAQLKPHLPPGDAVLTAWYRSLQDFKKDLPVLYKLANDALKVHANWLLCPFSFINSFSFFTRLPALVSASGVGLTDRHTD